jgi:hypothetical protein
MWGVGKGDAQPVQAPLFSQTAGHMQAVCDGMAQIVIPPDAVLRPMSICARDPPPPPSLPFPLQLYGVTLHQQQAGGVQMDE